MTSKLQIGCEALMEAAWLAVVVTIPLFFNISSSRMFEPDKVYVLQSLVAISGAAWLLKRFSVSSAKSDRAGAVGQQTRFFKLPLVIPVFAFAAIYTLSSLFSISPIESWWGSYVRSQGTIVFYCYTILFLIVLGELRTSAQLKRLQYAFILTSLPVSAYPVLQFLGMDPIPWTNFIPDRTSGSMGNPIFLGAYLIMVIPLTISRFVDAIGMLRTNSARRPGFVLAGCCGAALIMQFLALLCTQSRGPVMGLVIAGYICFFIFLVLRRTGGSRGFLYPAIAVGLGCVAPVLLGAIAYLVSTLSTLAAAMWLGAAILIVGTVYLLLWRIPWGRNWLWLTWLIQTAAILTIIVIGPARIIGQDVAFPRIGRWTKISGGSVDARYYLWQTGYKILRSGPSATLPNGSKDSFHSLRPAIGYGPECVRFPVNLHAPAELIEIHSGTSNRMHNETFDNLISIGFAGAIMYLLLISAAIFYSLQFMDLMSGRRQKIVFAVLLLLGGGAGTLLPWLAGSPYLIGIGVQAGLLLGLFAYIAWRGFRSTGAASAGNSQQIFVLCVLGSLIAHFVETAVGIAVTPTRTYFFLLLALLSVLAARRVKQDSSAKKRKSKPLPWFRTPLPGFIAIASFAVLTEAWCFIVNTTAERSAVRLFIDNWFIQSRQLAGVMLSGNLIILLLTISGGIALTYAEKSNLHLSKRDSGKISSVFSTTLIIVWLAMGFLAAVFWAAGDPSTSSPVDVSIHSEARITLFLLGLLVLLAATVLVLVVADFQKYKEASSARVQSFWLGLLLSMGALVIIFALSVRPAWADIACHIARVYERAGNLPAAIQVYERASHLAPRSTSYLISLGGAQGSLAAPNSSQLQESAKTLQRAVDLNPLDPASHRALGAFYMQTGERALHDVDRDSQVHKAITSFQRVIRLAPTNTDAYNELGRCYFLLGDYEKAGKYYEESLQVNPEDEQAYMYMGEMQYRLDDPESALQSFTEAARLEPDNIEAGKNIGAMLTLLGRKEEAIHEYLKTLDMAPRDLTLLRQLSLLYFSTGDYSSGLAFARRAYDSAPAEDKPDFDAFLEALRNQSQ